jgi:hypothetical protein
MGICGVCLGGISKIYSLVDTSPAYGGTVRAYRAERPSGGPLSFDLERVAGSARFRGARGSLAIDTRIQDDIWMDPGAQGGPGGGRTFNLEGRRGRFALSEDVARFLSVAAARPAPGSECESGSLSSPRPLMDSKGDS